ncbi:vicilin-like seed storage protein At2g28490 [Argentina anserina]|uniref:vicilin-like seed storage protein At2g28490 n=1 Tax=Argentina anserina TaxID=57926 RepID=UPI0021761FAB|nr:vicilin-like seed storage protein At2g28490 [Potentilla anserina]
MGNRVMVSPLALVLLLSYGIFAMAMNFNHEDEDWGRDQREEEWEGHHHRGHHQYFLLQRSRVLVKTEAGEMRVVRSVGQKLANRHINVGFLTLEPNSLFIPQYLDSSLILFVQNGQANVGLVHRNELGERQLKAGDVYRIPAGSTFYLQNVRENQRLQIILSVDTSDSLRMGNLENFFIGGGTHPKSVLSGFDSEILTSAFNVSSSELRQVLTRHQEGAIVYLKNSQSPSNLWAKFLSMKEQDRLQQLKKLVDFSEEPEQTLTWSWRKLLTSVFGKLENEKKRKQQHHEHSQESYNLYDRKPDFKNNHGWTLAVDESDFSPLKNSGVGVHIVSLNAGSMLAPHVNPTATEYGVVTRGSGQLQIVFPNGTLAMKAKLKPGRVFWVPRYFPFVQVASNNEKLEIFGFTTSPQPNQPQYLAGSSSVLQALRGQELAAAFGVSEGRLNHFVNAQREAVILPYNAERN